MPLSRFVLALFWLSAIGVVLVAPEVIAAKCSPPRSVIDEFRTTDVVFIGEVTAIESIRTTDRVPVRGSIFTFTIKEMFKGDLQESLNIYSYARSGESYYDFKLNERYLVFATGYDKSKQLITTRCTATKPFNKAAKDINELRGISLSWSKG